MENMYYHIDSSSYSMDATTAAMYQQSQASHYPASGLPYMPVASSSAAYASTGPTTGRMSTNMHPSMHSSRRSYSPDNLIGLEDPTRPRRYITPSSTSRKDIPSIYLKNRHTSQPSDEDDDEEQPLSANATEQEKIEWKRRQNTLAARRTRRKKVMYTQQLEETVERQRMEREMWRTRALTLKQLHGSHGLPVPDFKDPFPDYKDPDPDSSRRRYSPDNLIGLEDPTQSRCYITPSSTSRKDIPSIYLKNRRTSQPSDEEDDGLTEEQPLSANATDQEKIEWKRRQNTLAARRSRRKKAMYTQQLEETVERLRMEREMWRTRALTLKQLLGSHGLPVPDFKDSDSDYKDPDPDYKDPFPDYKDPEPGCNSLEAGAVSSSDVTENSDFCSVSVGPKNFQPSPSPSIPHPSPSSPYVSIPAKINEPSPSPSPSPSLTPPSSPLPKAYQSLDDLFSSKPVQPNATFMPEETFPETVTDVWRGRRRESVSPYPSLAPPPPSFPLPKAHQSPDHLFSSKPVQPNATVMPEETFPETVTDVWKERRRELVDTCKGTVALVEKEARASKEDNGKTRRSGGPATSLSLTWITKKKLKHIDWSPIAPGSCPEPISDVPDPPKFGSLTASIAAPLTRRFYPYWLNDWIFLMHHDWGWLASGEDNIPSADGQKHDKTNFINHLLAEWSSSSSSSAFSHANGFGIQGSSFANAQNVYYTINHNWPTPADNTGPSSYELQQQIQKLQRQIEDERTIRQQNERRNERTFSDIRQSLLRLEARLPPGPEPPPGQETSKHDVIANIVDSEIMQILNRLERRLSSQTGDSQENLHKSEPFEVSSCRHHCCNGCEGSSSSRHNASPLPHPYLDLGGTSVERQQNAAVHESRDNRLSSHKYHPYKRHSSQLVGGFDQAQTPVTSYDTPGRGASDSECQTSSESQRPKVSFLLSETRSRRRSTARFHPYGAVRPRSRVHVSRSTVDASLHHL